MTNYTQISREERVIIADLWRRGKTFNHIAKWLNRKHDTIRLEIERNGEINKYGVLVYTTIKAHKKYIQRRRETKKKERVIENNFKLESKIINLITESQFSPEQISKRYDTVSHQTIYTWIYQMTDITLKKRIVSHLRRRGKTYRKTSKLHTFQSITAPKTMIDERSKEIELRERNGDFEGDTVLLNGLERLYTLVDRRSRYVFIKHIPNGHAQTIYDETIKLHRRYKDIFLSITFDNGVEFSFHDLITLDTGIPIYFAYAYHSWERGTNENTNGLIRQYLPKGVEHGIIKSSDIKLIEYKLNNRPRKVLNYLTPYEVFVLKMNPDEFQVQPLI